MTAILRGVCVSTFISKFIYGSTFSTISLMMIDKCLSIPSCSNQLCNKQRGALTYFIIFTSIYTNHIHVNHIKMTHHRIE